jgi:two-component system, OmpR family, KDP operon response regulator KdpE
VSAMDFHDSILIIDDEEQILRLLDISLGSKGYKIFLAANGKEGIVATATNNPSLVILDLGLPDMDGLEVLKQIRVWFHKPILILSVRNSEDDIIAALDSGANDYLVKPFRTGELLARVRSAIRLSQAGTESPKLEFGMLSIDLVNHIVKNEDEILKLTHTEYSLLTLLAKNSGRVLTHRFLLKEIWGPGYTDQTQYLRVFIAQLRKKIEEDPTKPKLIITESGIGYRFSE